MSPLVTNYRVQEMEGCTFSSCGRFSVADPSIIYSIPTNFSLSSSLQLKSHFKNDDFHLFRGYAKKVLGDKFEKYKNAYDLARRCGNKKFVPHRLIYLDERIEASIAGLQAARPNADIPAFVEIGFFKFLLEKFRTNHSWSEFRDELRSTGSFVHHLVSLIYVYTIRLRGTNIDFVASNNDQARGADIVIFTPLKAKIDVEVKAPKLLWGSEEITEEQAAKVLEKCWKSSKGQRKGETTVLVIGGIYVPKKNIELLGEAAKKLLERRKNTSVLLIDIISYTMLVDKPKSISPLVFGPETTATPQFTRRTAVNPHYDGIVKLIETDHEEKGLSKEQRETTEISVGPVEELDEPEDGIV